MLDIPAFVNGIDLETKSVAVNAWVIGIGMATYDVRTLKQISTLNICIDPEDDVQNKLGRDISDSTMRWWFPEEPDEWSPSDLARKWSWGGKTPTESALSVVDKYLRECRKDKSMVHTMCGPEFDYVILQSLYEQLDRYLDIRFSSLDSVRTVRRVMHALGFPPYNKNEEEHISYSDRRHIPHVAVCDAAFEAYETAKMYHLMWWIRNKGFDKAMEVANGWKDGVFEEIPDEQ